ncbi:carboxymuconolactone decarboxylase family protein [Amycolatopsis sp. cmx-11-12]|uniref:carboxymuconolactone decarboxylase family protein n=1 Tax=Amycolatopsis sp. cmx-11-12 TaxID=2785795 RepID=UPI00391849AC
MSHITVDPTKPGIIGLFAFRPETAKPLGELVETLLRGPSSLTTGERELIGAVVSKENDCYFCAEAHGAFSAAQIEGGSATVDSAKQDIDTAPISDKLRALLKVALATRESGHSVTSALVENAKAAGASEADIHDTVLIASLFSLFNRYVDGLATDAPDQAEWYAGAAQALVAGGYAAISGAAQADAQAA